MLFCGSPERPESHPHDQDLLTIRADRDVYYYGAWAGCLPWAVKVQGLIYRGFFSENPGRYSFRVSV